MNRLLFPLFAFPLFAAALLTAACDVRVGQNGVSVDIAEGKATEEWVRTYSVSPGGTLEVINVNGTIDAAASKGREVEIRAVREARAGSDEAAQALLEKSGILEEVAPDRVKVEATAVRDDGLRSFGRRSQVSVRYDVRLPDGLTATFRTENGGVRLDNVGGRLTASTTNGAITGQNLSGALSATTVNGGVQVSLASVTGDVDVSTVNGGIRLELAPDVKARIEASAVNGGVSVDEALSLEVEEKARLRVSGRLNGGGPAISARTTNGGVRIAAWRP